MDRFLAIYTGSAEARERSGWDRLPEAERAQREAAGMQAWGEWMQRHADAVVESGGPLGATRKVSSAGITDISNALVGYVIVQAESHAAAARMFENHPHFAIFPGDGVEVMTCPPIPER